MMIEIIAERCHKDMFCVQECPVGLFALDADGRPLFRRETAHYCVECGHCLAVCPSGAVVMDGIQADDCHALDRADAPTAVQADHLILSRRSIRRFKTEAVPAADIAEAIDRTRWAPSAKNVQPVKWIVVNSAEQVKDLASFVVDMFRQEGWYPGIVKAWEKGVDMIHRDAPQMLIAYAQNDEMMPVEDCTIALTTFELAAAARGIGTCWAGFFMAAANRYEPVAKYIDLPEGHKVYGALMLGYPRFRYYRVPPRRPANVTWL